MKHINYAKILSGSLLALGLAAFFCAGGAYAQTASTTEPMISSISTASSADGMSETIMWMTDESSNSQIAFGLSQPYTSTTTLDTATTTSHSEVVTGLTPAAIYHFQVISTDASNNTSRSGDQVFTTAMATTSSTGTTTSGNPSLSDLQSQISLLQNDMNALQARLNTLWQELGALLGGNTGGNNGGTVVTGTPSLAPSTATVSAGHTSIIDFNGRNFGHEEQVTIALNGNQIGSAYADGGGNFTTGSMSIPSTAGTYTYTFTGANSGTTLTSTVTVQ